VSRSTPTRLIAALAAVGLLVAACGDDDDGVAPEVEVDAGDVTSVPAASESVFPVTVAAENGDVVIAAAPERIVSLSPSLTEMLFAIGAGPQVVAADSNSDFPEGVPSTDLSGFRPNVEAIAGYEPDLVVLSGDRDGIVDALEGVGVPALVLSSADNLDQVYAQIEALGDATDHLGEAVELTTSMKEEVDEIVADAPDRAEPLDCFYELSDDLSTVTSDTFIGVLLGLTGCESIADGVDPAAGQFPKLTTEYVLDADPDVIFLAHTDGTGVDAAAVADRPGWEDLQAVQGDHVVVLPTDVASRWGPRVVELLRAMTDATAGTGD
jgi:iron complex transport system substrate-binding protein